jgi:hypothetical protein
MQSYLADTRFAADSLIEAYIGGLDDLNSAIRRYNDKVTQFGAYSGDMISM